MDADVETIRAWFAFLVATRQGYLGTLTKLPPAKLARDRGASYPPFWTSLRTRTARSITG